MQKAQQRDDHDGGGKETEKPIAKVAGRIGVCFQRSGQYKAADHKEADDSANTVCKALERLEGDGIPSGGRSVRKMAPSVVADNRQSREAA